MLKAYHGNRVLRIPDEKKKDYIALGYKITDMDGKVLYDPVNNTDNVKELQAAVAEKEKTIEELSKKVEELVAAVAEKEKTIKDLTSKVAEKEKKAPSAGKAEK